MSVADGWPSTTTRGDRVAEHETAAGSEGLESDGLAPASRADAIASIDDTIVRRLVRIAVHVRGYAPYYVATLALFGFLAFGPRPDSRAGDDAALGRSAGSAAGGAVTNGGGAGRSGSTSPTRLSPRAAGTLLAGAAGLDGSGLASGEAGGVFGIAGDATTSAGPSLPDTPAAPDVESFDPGDVDYGTDLPDACTVALPSPAPSVSPSREVEGLQTTLEAAAGLEAPADLSPYVEDAASTAGCPDASELPVPIPAVPGLPV